VPFVEGQSVVAVRRVGRYNRAKKACQHNKAAANTTSGKGHKCEKRWWKWRCFENFTQSDSCTEGKVWRCV